MDPRKVLRKEPTTYVTPFLERYTSPANELAMLRKDRKWRGSEANDRMERLINKKWRLIYGMRYDEENRS